MVLNPRVLPTHHPFSHNLDSPQHYLDKYQLRSNVFSLPNPFNHSGYRPSTGAHLYLVHDPTHPRCPDANEYW